MQIGERGLYLPGRRLGRQQISVWRSQGEGSLGEAFISVDPAHQPHL